MAARLISFRGPTTAILIPIVFLKMSYFVFIYDGITVVFISFLEYNNMYNDVKTILYNRGTAVSMTVSRAYCERGTIRYLGIERDCIIVNSRAFEGTS